MLKLWCTHHAHLRARQRNGWSRASTDRMLERVFYTGVGWADCKGALRRYLINLPHDPDLNCARIYGEQVYLFARPRSDAVALITVYLLPPAFRPAAHRALRAHYARRA